MPQLPKDMLCVVLESGACQVDSGGPLICSYSHTMKWFQVGIISWGDDCSVRPYHQFYTSVYNYYEWIKTETAMMGKPFLIEGMAKRVPSPMEVPSGAKAQLVFLESVFFLFASLVAIVLF
ncbi:hypothetical protein ASZ78_001727 [Callipepla squamata]|uniref:Peptidase S1 domain-containing protein n=1 Tax=Callipepla squamata TaxID=9009 RepID=A0A226N2X9_CALSU|nr:hypothetical protein ASZ78_001727 [Callipepla squamata]